MLKFKCYIFFFLKLALPLLAYISELLPDQFTLLSQAASSATYVDFCLDMLVCDFVPPVRLLNFLEQPHGVTRKYQVLDRIHSTLKDISDLVPLSPLRLEKIIRDRMPIAQWKEHRVCALSLSAYQTSAFLAFFCLLDE